MYWTDLPLPLSLINMFDKYGVFVWQKSTFGKKYFYYICTACSTIDCATVQSYIKVQVCNKLIKLKCTPNDVHNISS